MDHTEPMHSFPISQPSSDYDFSCLSNNSIKMTYLKLNHLKFLNLTQSYYDGLVF